MAKVLPLVLLALSVVGCQPKEDATIFKTDPKTRSLTGAGEPGPAAAGAVQESSPGGQVAKRLEGNKGPQHISAETMPSGTAKRAGAPPPMPGYSGRPEAPAWPKPDETLTKKWEKGGSSLELLGVCHITEDAIRAWNTDGQEDSQLKALVEGALTKQEFGGNSVSIKYGKKNRVLIFRSTYSYQAAPNGVAYGPPMISGVGPRQDPGGGGGFLNIPSDTNSGNSSTTYRTYALAADPSEKTTVAHLVQTEGLSETKTVPLKVGTSVTMQGVTLSIVSISKADPATQGAMMFGAGGGAAWTVEVKKSGTWPQGVSYDFSLNEHMEVDGAGDPLTQAQKLEREKKMQEAMRQSNGPYMGMFPMPRTAGLHRIGGATDTITYGLNVNPKHVKELVVRGTKQRKIDITDIPLDPK